MSIIDQIQGFLQPVIVDYLVWAVLAVIAWFMRRLPAKWRVEIEAKHRAALKEAIDTGVGLVIDKIQASAPIGIGDEAVSIVIEHVYGSVPDAVKFLMPSRVTLENLIQSHLTRELDRFFNRDHLSEELVLAGAREAGLDD